MLAGKPSCYNGTVISIVLSTGARELFYINILAIYSYIHQPVMLLNKPHKIGTCSSSLQCL